MYKLNNRGLNISPCKTPWVTFTKSVTPSVVLMAILANLYICWHRLAKWELKPFWKSVCHNKEPRTYIKFIVNLIYYQCLNLFRRASYNPI